MKLKGYGEDRLVAELTQGLPEVGDDCAVVPGRSPKEYMLLKTDAVVEDVHFLRSAKPAQIGWKAMCRPISDIAAMGGTPEEALVTLGLPESLDVTFVKRVFAGLRRAASEFGVRIVGGETCRSPGPMFISVSLTGRVEKARCVPRHGASPGDLIYVTGKLGGSIRGKHLTFRPRLAEGQFLAKLGVVTSMMDLSDGLGADLPRLLGHGNFGAEIVSGALPCNRGVTPQQAFDDGEDYELLFTIGEKDERKLLSAWSSQFANVPLSRIGRVTKSGPKTRKRTRHGYDHFR